ncbi:MAG: hypothetical protein LBI63_04090 [Candidatus Ancillula sp.]|jgi:shikimate dehydrogenase|nr:hypothetical protein [Candidatus Ancillula sp.]
MKAAVIGTPIAHSKSPILHNAAYTALGIGNSWNYTKFEVDENSLGEFMRQLDNSWAGFSVTMPLKQAVIAHLDEISTEAMQTNAVNTVIIQPDKSRPQKLHLTGYNTDIYGIEQAFCEASTPEKHQALQGGAIVLGSGATARSAVSALKKLLLNSSAQKITVISRKKAPWIQQAKLDWCSFDERARINALVDSSKYAVSTLPWDAAKLLLPTIFHQSFPLLLECAFPKVLDFSIGGERMLIHQAVLQVQLMIKCEKRNIDVKKTTEVMTTALQKWEEG